MNRLSYEAPSTRHILIRKPPRLLNRLEVDSSKLEWKIAGLLKGLLA